MTDPFGDILAAISYGQSLSKKMTGLNRAQGSRLAWEQALLDAGAQFRESGSRGTAGFTVDAHHGTVTGSGSPSAGVSILL